MALTKERIAAALKNYEDPLDGESEKAQAGRIGEAEGWETVEPDPHDAPWPLMASGAFHGLAGEIVRHNDPTTEADPNAVLLTTLVYFGSACNRNPHVMVGDDRHGTNLNAIIVAESSKGRKGTSQAGPRRLLRIADEAWATNCVRGGTSTGEGVLWQIRDPIQKPGKDGVLECVDQGVDDKRLTLLESEFSQILKVAQRSGNTITETIRRLYDSDHLVEIITKANPARATDPHVSILGHITGQELRRSLTETDTANGFANRFLYCSARRSKYLPNPVRMTDAEAGELGRRLTAALIFARRSSDIRRDRQAEDLWAEIYRDLEQDPGGLAGAITARSAAMTIRLSLIYALLDSSSAIRREHLEAALAVWEFSEASVRYIFGDLTGDAVADRIIALLKATDHLTQTEISDALGRNQPAARITNALDLLHRSGRIVAKRVRQQSGPVRPVTRFEIAR